ncbi:hypothetical protein GII36_03415 [Candidatus Mycosynbacter amalyticus]|uniref:Uncharacterized protein n=1 Tax=Candidatus Mycosynbacter amalyticus TaxID=2665156 RepID=A0A857MU05_9BACT|nr:hypothetical protein [Candidatus Mycosynbacter amalyticus]QHN42887.1 hypothetical protein GII36_03415 [Candidatus Mycosynbacter amalyticus]
MNVNIKNPRVIGIVVAIILLTGIAGSIYIVNRPSSTATKNTASTTTPKASCQLADISDVATSEFVEQGNVEASAAERCGVPKDAAILDWTRAHSLKIDGVVLFDDGKTVYHTSDGSNCTVLVGYLSNEQSYTPYPADYPEKLRFATPEEALDAGYAKDCQ